MKEGCLRGFFPFFFLKWPFFKQYEKFIRGQIWTYGLPMSQTIVRIQKGKYMVHLNALPFILIFFGI